jgi:hypothetical protein
MKLPPSPEPNRDPKTNRDWSSYLKMPSTKPAKSLDDLMANAEQNAELAMRQMGRFPPTLFGLGADGPFVLVSESLANSDAKDHFVNAARLMCVAFGATAMVMAIEAWAKFAQPGETLDPTESPSEAMDRREVVILVGETYGTQKKKCLPIIRTDAGGFFGFGEANLPQFDQATGRFAHILPPRAPTPNHRLLAIVALEAQGIVLDKLRS